MPRKVLRMSLPGRKPPIALQHNWYVGRDTLEVLDGTQEQRSSISSGLRLGANHNYTQINDVLSSSPSPRLLDRRHFMYYLLY